MKSSLRYWTLKVLSLALSDRLHNFLGFVYYHHRLPGKRSIPDIVYNLKNDKRELSTPVRTFVSDKELMKVFVNGILGPGRTVPSLLVTDDLERLRALKLSEPAVVKSTHGSGHIQFVKDKSEIDLKLCEKWLEENYYRTYRERNYKYLKPKIIIEPLVFGQEEPIDYKMFFIDGGFIFLQLDFDRQTAHTRMFFDRDFSPLGFSMKYPVAKHENFSTYRPENLNQMIEAGAELAKQFNGLIRIDFYTDGFNFYIGELTNCHGSGWEKIIPPEKATVVEQILSRTLRG